MRLRGEGCGEDGGGKRGLCRMLETAALRTKPEADEAVEGKGAVL